MGQVTLPVLNRKGYSSFWENSWDSKLNYTHNLNEDIFLKKFFKIFFKNWISTNIFFNKKFYLKNKNSIKKISIKKFIKTQEEYNDNIKKYLKKHKTKKFPYNFSKLFLLKFSKWVIIFAYIYVPKVWRVRLKKKKIKIHNKNNLENLYQYHSLKLKFLNNK